MPDTSQTLRVEIGCEEIPAGMVERIAREFAANLHQKLAQANLVGSGVTAMAHQWTPRRLIVEQHGVLVSQPFVEEEVVGPPAKIAFAADGTPTPQAVGFAAKNGLGADALYRVSTPKGEYLALKVKTGGKRAQDILKDAIPQALLEIKLPRSMKWDDSGIRFIRPIRSATALLGASPIAFTIGHVPSGSTMADDGVVRDPARRRQIILEAAGPDIRPDAGLLDTLVNLTERPDAVRGGFDEAYLKLLPSEVIVTVMRDHQKYFAVQDASGALKNAFVAIVNRQGDPQGLIRRGNERVLRARFSDAQFFYDTDRKLSLGERLPMLENVTFQAKLGSYRQKSLRMKALAGWLASQWPGTDGQAAAVAAELAKCDLTSEMVKEFTELQGVMGGYYARASGQNVVVADAIADQYLWETAPRTNVGAAVSIADRLDTIVGMFAIGEIPSGSADPFGLRRQANGIIRTLIERQLPLVVSQAIGQAHAGYAGLPGLLLPELAAFFKERLSFYLRESGGYDAALVNAVLAAGGDDPLDAAARAAALAAAPDASAVAAVIKRARNIVRKENWTRSDVDSARLAAPAEQALHAAVAALPASADYAAELTAIAALATPLERFFNEVRVNDEDAAVRANRLSLLAWTVARLSRVADFAELAG